MTFDPREKALNHFDDFYKALFLEQWPSIRLALLTKQKYLAVINNFAKTEGTEEFLESKGAFNFINLLKVHKSYNDEAEVQNCAKADNKVQIEGVIEGKVKEADISGLSEYIPDAENFKMKADLLRQDTKKEDSAQGPSYRPEDATTSLHSDLQTSEIDFSRVIDPDSPKAHGNLQEFVPATVLRGLEDYISESEYYKYYQMESSAPITIEKEYDMEFPEKLRVYTFDRGDISEFPDPYRDINDVYTYLTVEGSELLTILALGVAPGDTVLDLCSQSGSMAYCIFQTLRAKTLVCITSGSNHTGNLFCNCLHDYSAIWRDMLVIAPKNFADYEKAEIFDKVLINVPSTEDKEAVLETEKNLFHPRKLLRRLKLPQFQCMLLQKALKMVRPGGTVVYSTSTLSPVQNEGVVNSALTAAWEQDKMKFIVKDLSPALKHMRLFYNVKDCINMKYGTLVLPFVPVNFGPKYFCKIVKKANE